MDELAGAGEKDAEAVIRETGAATAGARTGEHP